MAGYYIWKTWTDTSSCTSIASTVWNDWNSTRATTSSTATSVTAWVEWNTDTSACNSVRIRTQPVYTPAPQPTPEQVEAEKKRQAAWEAKEKKRIAEEKAANEKAEALLHSCLNRRQRKSYRHNRSFRVRTRDGRRFRIAHGWAGNVTELNQQNRPIARFCIHPRDYVPHADNMLTQKFLLETDPERFLQTANRTAIAP